MSPLAAKKRVARHRWGWVLVWIVFSFTAAGFSWHSHRKFSSAIAEAFNQQQGLSVRLIERLVQQHINEGMLLLAHVRGRSAGAPRRGPPTTPRQRPRSPRDASISSSASA